MNSGFECYRRAGVCYLICISTCIIWLFLHACSNDMESDALKAEIISPGIDIEIRENESVFFRGLASGGSPPYEYLWDLGLVAPGIPAQHTAEIIFEYEGAYMATLIVTDSKEGQARDTVRVIVTPKDPMR